ncbi:MAG: alpha/beta hydrolase family protein [Candidatus Longimicrobiales bacterium M2_2A_002]
MDTQRTIQVEGQGTVSGLLRLPDDAMALYVLAHGAGAGMAHPFMGAVADILAERGIGTLRYQFPYMERGGFPPDRPPVAVATVRAAVEAARREAAAFGEQRGRAPTLLAGGKSFGARMTSTAAARAPLPGVAGLVFLGWPLHTAKNPGTKRAAHLPDVTVPMLFVQGDRDRLADLDLLRPVVDGLGDRASLHVVDDADHGFEVLKRSARTKAEVMAEIGDGVAEWVETIG